MAESNPKKRGLGRGLNALFEDEEILMPQGKSEDERSSGRARMSVGIDQLSAGAGQPRRKFVEESLDELADSIREHGILQPLLVREKDGGAGQYEIIAGERRWRAAQRAQLHEVPVIVLDLSDVQAYEVALIENLQREDLDPIDEAIGYDKMLSVHKYSQEQLAKSLGKSRPHITNMLRLLTLPKSVQDMLREGKLTMGHARALITAANPEDLAHEIIGQNLSVRDVEKLARNKEKKSGAKKGGGKDADTLALQRDVENILGMKVTITPRAHGAGSIKIDYATLDQLDDLVLRLSKFPDMRLKG